MAELALRQHGVVARRQLLALGLGRRAVGHRVERGRLHVVHQGVYAVGHRGLAGDGHVMAAVLAGGEGAVASHRSAGALWGICADRGSAVEISVPATRRDRPRIAQHQASVPHDERTTIRGIPVTTAFRTLLDLAAVVDRRRLRRAVHEAEVLRLWDEVSLDGHATHATRRGFERDRERDRVLQAAGWRVVRVTWRQLHAAPGAVADDLRALLNARSPDG